jgi:hypothetical protein
MRLWSLHPRSLDTKGLVTLWREGLLARAVLLGKTKGYRFHPQLERFRARRDPVKALDCYLSRVLDEARERGYHFDASKILYARCGHQPAKVTRGQLAYEWGHLLNKLQTRDPERWRLNRNKRPAVHPCFCVVPGKIESWERPTGRTGSRRPGLPSSG